MNKWLPIIGAVVALGINAGIILYFKGKPKSSLPTPTPTPEAAVQLAADKQPRVELKFASDGHYVTVSLSNLNADQLEYNSYMTPWLKAASFRPALTPPPILPVNPHFLKNNCLAPNPPASSHITKNCQRRHGINSPRRLRPLHLHRLLSLYRHPGKSVTLTAQSKRTRFLRFLLVLTRRENRFIVV